MSSTVIIANATGTAIVMINPTVEAERIAADYTYYKSHPDYVRMQAEHDATIEKFGGTRIDLAWAKAQDRARNRNRPSWETDRAYYKAGVERKRYAHAVGA